MLQNISTKESLSYVTLTAFNCMLAKKNVAVYLFNKLT